MLGASALKLLKYLMEGMLPSGIEIGVLLTGCVVSFLVSVLVIRVLMDFVRKRSFAPFGVYRMILGAAVLAYFLLK
jgi:undecaprenyl-diphosphatase